MLLYQVINPFLGVFSHLDLVVPVINKKKRATLLFSHPHLMGNLHAVKVTNISMIPGAVRINANLSGDVKIITTDF